MNFKKILVAVDASENSFRAVEYVGEIVGSSPGFEITLLMVFRPPSRDLFPDEAAYNARISEIKSNAEAFFKKAEKELEGKGVSSHSVASVCLDAVGTSIAQNILDFQQSGSYGTVVVGRRGVSKAEEFLFGSVSNKIVHYAKNCTIWVVE